MQKRDEMSPVARGQRFVHLALFVLLLLSAVGLPIAAVEDNPDVVTSDEEGESAGRGVHSEPASHPLDLVPFYTFDHTNTVFLGLQDGTLLCLDIADGDELWRLDTGGLMVQSLVSQPPTDTVQRNNPLSMPFGVRGQWLHTRHPNGRGFSENPFLHLTQLLQRPLIVDDRTGTEIITTASAQHFVVDEKGVKSAGSRLPQLPATTPAVRVIRYNVHVRASGIGFEWNMTVSTLKVAPRRFGRHPGVEEHFNENRRRPFMESHDPRRAHVVADNVLDSVSYVTADKVTWKISVPSIPVVAFQWVGSQVELMDLLGADQRRMMQLALPELASNIMDAATSFSSPLGQLDPATSDKLLPSPPTFPHPLSLDPSGHGKLPPYYDPDEHWTAISRMHIFFYCSLVVFFAVVLVVFGSVFQRRNLQQFWEQFDQLENALRVQQKVNQNQLPASQPPSTILGPLTGTEIPTSPIATSVKSEEWDRSETGDSANYWDPLPPAQNSSSGRFKEPTPAAPPTLSLLNLHFTLIRRIASGGGGAVFEARHNMTDVTYAIKVIALSSDEERIKREAVLHSKLEHKNVVRFFNCWTEELSAEVSANMSLLDSADDDEFTMSTLASSTPSTPTSANSRGDDDDDENGKFVFIQMEYFKNGTLADYLKANSKHGVNREENLSLLLMVVRGLEYIHASDVVHRDLKPTNIFMSDDYVAKIGDFGMSFTNQHSIQELAEAAYANEGNDTYGVGSPLYSSPEQLETGKATAASDIYSLGILAGEMFHQFNTTHERLDVLQRMRTGLFEATTIERYPEEVELIKRMTKPTPKQRASLKEIHETLKKLIKMARSPPMGSQVPMERQPTID